MKFKVTYLDGREVEVVAGPKAQVMFERKFNVSFNEITHIEHFYGLAHLALFHAGKEPNKDFDNWLDSIEDVDPVDVNAKPDPTPPGQLSET